MTLSEKAKRHEEGMRRTDCEARGLRIEAASRRFKNLGLTWPPLEPWVRPGWKPALGLPGEMNFAPFAAFGDGQKRSHLCSVVLRCEDL